MARLVNEDKRLEPYKVWFTPNVRNEIEVIKAYNRNNIEGVRLLQDYLQGLRMHISNPVLAWDNVHKYSHHPNGVTHFNELGYNFAYIIKNSKFDNKQYVCVVKIFYNLAEFGLKNPFVTNIASEGLNDKRIDKIIKETINNYLRKNLLLID